MGLPLSRNLSEAEPAFFDQECTKLCVPGKQKLRLRVFILIEKEAGRELAGPIPFRNGRSGSQARISPPFVHSNEHSGAPVADGGKLSLESIRVQVDRGGLFQCSG